MQSFANLLNKSHNNTSKAVRLYTKVNKLDFLINQPKWHIFEGNLNEDSDLEEYVTELSQFFLDARKFIHVVGGELCSRVWNHDKIIKALETSKATDICFICGPVLDIHNHKLLKLVKEMKIRLIYSSERQKEHFRVTDKGIFIAGFHDAFMPERSAIFCRNSSIIS